MSVVCLRCCLTSLPLHAEAHSGSKGPHPGHTVSTLKCQRDSQVSCLAGSFITIVHVQTEQQGW